MAFRPFRPPPDIGCHSVVLFVAIFPQTCLILSYFTPPVPLIAFSPALTTTSPVACVAFRPVCGGNWPLRLRVTAFLALRIEYLERSERSKCFGEVPLEECSGQKSLLDRRRCTCWTTRLLTGVKGHHGQWPEGPPVHCAVSQPVSTHQLLISEPASLVQSRGSVARLRCSADPPSATVSWRFRGLPLDQDTLPGVELNGGSLTISSLKPGHVGLYQCVARFDHGPAVASRLARVDIAGDYLVLPSGNLQIVSASVQHQGMYKCGALNPVTGETVVQPHGTKLSVKHSDAPSSVRIVYPTASVTVEVPLSQPLTLECVVSGSPAPAAKWFQNGKEVTPGPLHRQRHNNLAFVAVTRSDEGSYNCATETEQGTVISPNYTVNVLEPVSVVKGLSDQLVPPGSSAHFTCAARGNPSPNITWLFNADPIAPSRRFQISGSSLVISDVTPRDAGVYQCLLDNGIGSAQSQGMLTTQSDPQLGPTAGVLLEASPSLHPMQSDEGRDEDAGDAGDAIDLPPDRSSDRPTPEAPIITSPPQTHKPDLYDLEWRAGRDGGSPIVAYFVKYLRVPGSEKTLRLSELESSSLYEVLMVARSSAGEGQPAMLTFRTGKEKSTTSNKNPSKPPVVPMPPKAPEDKNPNTHFGVIIHDRVPEAPDRPTISMATESSVYVTWIPRANGGSPITAFRVEYRRGRVAEWVVAADNISPLKLSVEVRNLEPGSIYKFRVVAVNMYGESPHSIPSKPYQVPQASPRMADRPVVGPHISSTDAISDTQIMLRWTVRTPQTHTTHTRCFGSFTTFFRSRIPDPNFCK
ncbi:hypothetical protein F2P81_016882 [Scophthalmus maximus]|uniref:Cell adhesion molecule-related/down-regulated by oncogenes-like n=1 Tax=Scophthalmus maximus TaxID=52904 RepID=A0A6A4SG65_SCOMX|nr:hypothetical protein F2P81_016882 [Scophthalmus maximus]